MNFSRFLKRVKLKFFLLQVQSDERELNRMRRLQKIRSTKSQLLRDVIIGQNIGDFSLSDQDLKDVICMNYTTPIHKIFEIHQKYRGYEARIPR